MRLVCIVTLVLGLVSATVNAGPKVNMDGDSNTWFRVRLLGQVQFLNKDGAADDNDTFLRRARLIVDGQIADGIQFFVETDNDNAGRNGAGSVSTDIQDAQMDFRLCKTDWQEHWVKAGLILLPFSFETRSSAATLLGLDYNSDAIKLVNNFVWRDNGAELHGNFGKYFSYIVGGFDGYDTSGSTKNPDAAVRMTGHVALNLLGEAETGPFYTQERLGSKASYLSIGVGGDSQKRATLTPASTNTAGVVTPASIQDSDASVVDLQSGWKCGDDVNVTVNGAWYTWDNSTFKGNTAFVESGCKYKNCMLTGKYTVQSQDGKADKTDYTGGLHYYFKGDGAKVGVEYQWGDNPDQILAGLQFLL